MLILWGTYILKPIKVVAIFVHEIGHALMMWMFFGNSVQVNLTLSEVGHTIPVTNERFWTFIIANGGYIMSLMFSILILRIRNLKFRRYSLGLVSVWVLISLIYVEKIPASFLYVIIFSIITIIAYIINSDKIFEWMGDIIGISSIAYCMYETFMKDMLPIVALKVDLLKGIANNEIGIRDTEILYDVTGVPAVVWGTFWFVISLLVMMFCMRGMAKNKKKILKVERLGIDDTGRNFKAKRKNKLL